MSKLIADNSRSVQKLKTAKVAANQQQSNLDLTDASAFVNNSKQNIKASIDLLANEASGFLKESNSKDTNNNNHQPLFQLQPGGGIPRIPKSKIKIKKKKKTYKVASTENVDLTAAEQEI